MTQLQLFNTMGRKLMPFVPLVEGSVGLYCCGLTVYNFAHVGNLRAYIFEDVLRRTLEYSGFQVNHVMNVTDVGHLSDDADSGEDKMLKAAVEAGKTPWEIAEFYTKAFFTDLDSLNVLMPTTVCKATDHIPDMIALIQRIEANGFTYFSGGNLYFDISKFPEYGRLALLSLDDLKAGSRIEVDKNKKNPHDFVLWFTQSKFEHQAMLWDSPWGRGYPGWHIECSAMSMKYLGEQFDIHCGGIDHIPVHHTNEIAQAEAATGKKWVNYWLHNEFLLFGTEKMSKSLGNFVTLTTLGEKGYAPLDYRFFCLGASYRSQLKLSDEGLQAAKNGRAALSEKIILLKEDAGGAEGNAKSAPAASFLASFEEHIALDLNTPQALGDLWGLLRDEKVPAADRLAAAYEMDRVFGLGLKETEREKVDLDDEVIALVEEREAARKAKNFARADEIRKILEDRGIVLEDTPQGVRWRKK
ncbi:MAG: cysteine--tRNA ligase [Spirochaetales bacterium]|nr:cysteine--tRNA ligase [Spirochaetales bacterium]